jgi:hypothetical protein
VEADGGSLVLWDATHVILRTEECHALVALSVSERQVKCVLSKRPDAEQNVFPYQRGEVGVQLLALVVVLLQPCDAAAQVPAHFPGRGVALAHQDVQQTRLTCNINSASVG